jgi:hypothetical protein
MRFSTILESFIYNRLNQIDQNTFYINNITENEFNELNKNNEYTLLRPQEILGNNKIFKDVLTKEKFDKIICSIGVVEFEDLFVSRVHSDFLEGYYDPSEEGIVFLKKRNKDLIKSYDTIRDLNKDNIGFFINNKSNLKIIGYEINNFLNPISTIQIKSILFFCEITNHQMLPFKGSSIVRTVSRPDVNGQQIMYPLATYFSDNSTLISDRTIVSSFAKKVWKDFFATQNVLYPFAPIDNEDYPLTPETIDDGVVYSFIKSDLKYIISKYFKSDIKNILFKILECSNRNDLEKVKDTIEFIDINQKINDLIKTNSYIKQGTIFKFLYDIIIDNFKVDLSDLRKKNYLDWAYRINPSVQQNIKNVITTLISNHNQVSISNRDSKILEYAEILWDKRRV